MLLVCAAAMAILFASVAAAQPADDEERLKDIEQQLARGGVNTIAPSSRA
jgi:hypothetical protein